MKVNKIFTELFENYLETVSITEIQEFYCEYNELINDSTIYNCFIYSCENSYIKLARWLYSLKRKLTIIIVSHRMSTLTKCDKIFKIDNCKIKKVLV